MVQAYDESSMVRVYVAQGQLQGEVIRTKLQAAGIPALLKYESVGVVMGLTFNGLGAVHVLVPAQFGDEALELLQVTDVVDDVDFAEDAAFAEDADFAEDVDFAEDADFVDDSDGEDDPES